MQGYLKFKEANSELYEVNFNFEKRPEKNMKNLIKYLTYFVIHAYLEIVVKIKEIFHMITVKEIYSGLIFTLPFSAEKSTEKQLKKCIPKVKKLMNKYQISTLVLSDKLRKNERFIENFQDNRELKKQVHILDGKEMMPYLIKEIIEYILQKQEKTIELEDLYILTKQDRSDYKENISFLSQYFKTINIITPCIKSYQKFADQLEQKCNTIVTVTNNKRKSLRKAKWVVNFDLLTDEIKKYTISRNATIIYLNKDGIYNGNGFEGVHICRAGIDVSQEIKDAFMKHRLLSQFSVTILYESIVLNKRSFNEVKLQMKKDKVQIAQLYGLRGVL